MKPMSAQAISQGVAAIGDDLGAKVTRTISRAMSAQIKAVSAKLKQGDIEEAKRLSSELEFKSAIEKTTAAVRSFTRASALVGAGAIDKPETAVMVSAGFPFEVDKSAVKLTQNMIEVGLTEQVRRRVRALVDRAARFQKASDPIDPDKLARDINRFLNGEIRRVVDVSANIVGTRVASHGMLYEARARGISRYRIDAVLDDRTTDICQNMHNREFSVETAFLGTQTALSITEPQAQKDFRPFLGIDQIRGATSKELQAQGFDTPPFHFLCRSVTVMLGTNTVYEKVPISKFPNTPPRNPEAAIEAYIAANSEVTQAAIGVSTPSDLLAAKAASNNMVELTGTNPILDRAFSINAYTGNQFNSINETLRSKGRWGSDTSRGITEVMDDIFRDIPATSDDQIIYRGTGAAVTDQLDSVGRVVQDDGFMSGSINPVVAADFRRGEAMLQILVPKGQKLLPVGELSLTPFEGEVILPRSSQFRVVGFTEMDLGSAGKVPVIRVVIQGQTAAPNVNNLPNFDEWIEAQESLVKTAEEERARAKFVYTAPRSIFSVGLG